MMVFYCLFCLFFSNYYIFLCIKEKVIIKIEFLHEKMVNTIRH